MKATAKDLSKNCFGEKLPHTKYHSEKSSAANQVLNTLN